MLLVAHAVEVDVETMADKKRFNLTTSCSMPQHRPRTNIGAVQTNCSRHCYVPESHEARERRKHADALHRRATLLCQFADHSARW